MKIVISCVLAMLLLAIGSCHRPQYATVLTAGKGGNSTITITPTHHGEFVDTCTLYIKYNTLDAPASGIYDDSMICALVDTIPVGSFTGLTQGNYYLFAKGYHSPYTPPYVKGGLPCEIRKDGATSIYLPTYSYQP